MGDSSSTPPVTFQGFSSGLAQALDDHTTELRNRIAAEASGLANSRNEPAGGQVSFDDLYEAIRNVEEKLQPRKEMSTLERWFSLFSLIDANSAATSGDLNFVFRRRLRPPLSWQS